MVNSKKKKAANNTKASYNDFNDQAALSRRAERFQREHDLERQKTLGGQVMPAHSNLLHRIHSNSNSRSASPSQWVSDGIEGDKVEGF